MILRRATYDKAFRAGLLVDPRATLHDTFGIGVAEGYRIQFIEKSTAYDAVVVLPPLRADGRLDDADLEGVVGGVGEAAWGDVLF
jgi:hypothetical protein